MKRPRFPRLRPLGWVGVALGALLLYLVLLSAVPALLRRGEERAVDLERARRAATAENWSLVSPAEREELSRAVDQAWRGLRVYRQEYRAGTPERLAAGRPLIASTSVFTLARGRIQLQQDTNFISADAPGSEGREVEFEGFRVRTDRPYVNERGARAGDAELIYQRLGGVWTCQRVLADREGALLPELSLGEAGDGGFRELDGRRVRGFVMSAGAFGLRSPAIVWLDVESLLVRGQELRLTLRPEQEVWRYSGFDEAVTITPPSGVACNDA